jgi:putative endonuclease
MWIVYIIQSEKDKTYYIGCTNNISKRLTEHNSGFSKYTSKKIHWKLRYVEKVADMKIAR